MSYDLDFHSLPFVVVCTCTFDVGIRKSAVDKTTTQRDPWLRSAQIAGTTAPSPCGWLKKSSTSAQHPSYAVRSPSMAIGWKQSQTSGVKLKALSQITWADSPSAKDSEVPKAWRFKGQSFGQ